MSRFNPGTTVRIAHKIADTAVRGTTNIITAEIALTYRCNLRCAYCDLAVFEEDGARRELSAEQFGEIFTRLERLGVERVNLSGGEPLLREDIPAILQAACAKKFRVNLTTNGVFVPRYIERLTGLDGLIISIDGAGSTHDYLRGPGMHAAALRALELSRHSRIPVMVSAVLTSKTSQADVGYLLALCEDMDISCIIQPMTRGVYVRNRWVPFTKAGPLTPTIAQLREVRGYLQKDPRRRRVIGGNYYFDEVIRWYRRCERKSAPEARCLAGNFLSVLPPREKFCPAVCVMKRVACLSGRIFPENRWGKRSGKRMHCRGCSCYAYMVLNGLAAMDMNTIRHCLTSMTTATP
jgi:Molybdenum cofactor biosynthesis enzyme